MHRRDMLKGLTLGAAGASPLIAAREDAVAQTSASATKGLPPLKITRVRAIATAPEGIRLIVVKVETSEPGLYGLGCATFQQRPLPVISAIDDYLDPFCRGKDPDTIEDMWQTAYVSSYWRNGPVLNNALSGLDQALWDIKGKRAGMPVHQLLGGKCRFAIPLYAHAGGDIPQISDQVQRFMEEGYRYIRIQPGQSGVATKEADFKAAGFGLSTDQYMEPAAFIRTVPKLFEHVRATCGDEINLMNDFVYQRILPLDAINLVKELARYNPFFIEDPFSPEDNGYFRLLRQQTACPLAMGEQFNSPHEWVPLITERLIDFLRLHLSQVGGITPALKAARLAEWFNVRTVWHGPGDVSPVGHAANAHIDYATWNFALQERHVFNQAAQDVFPGTPTIKNGYLHVNEAPGLGVDIDEKLAATFPYTGSTLMPFFDHPPRHNDGTVKRR